MYAGNSRDQQYDSISSFVNSDTVENRSILKFVSNLIIRQIKIQTLFNDFQYIVIRLPEISTLNYSKCFRFKYRYTYAQMLKNKVTDHKWINMNSLPIDETIWKLFKSITT